MDEFALTLKLGNDAMLTLDDIADALELVASKLRQGTSGTGKIRDANGNPVGSYETS